MHRHGRCSTGGRSNLAHRVEWNALSSLDARVEELGGDEAPGARANRFLALSDRRMTNGAQGGRDLLLKEQRRRLMSIEKLRRWRARQKAR